MSNFLTLFRKGPWRKGSAADSRSAGWEFESLWAHFFDLFIGAFLLSCIAPISVNACRFRLSAMLTASFDYATLLCWNE